METEVTKKRKLSAIMFTDLKDFSRSMGENESQTLRTLEQYNAMVNSSINIFEGTVVKTVGDGMLVDFSSAVNAVQCAVRIQAEALNYNKERPDDEKILIRVGIHIGEVVLLDGDIMGDAVNIASRIQPFAEPGGICISRDVYNQTHGKLNLKTVSLGAKELKNIREPVEIHKILVDSILDTTAVSYPSWIFPKGVSYSRYITKVIMIAVVIVISGAVARAFMGNVGDMAVKESARMNASVKYTRSDARGIKEEVVAAPTGIEGDYRVITVQIVRNGKVVSEETKKVAMKAADKQQ